MNHLIIIILMALNTTQNPEVPLKMPTNLFAQTKTATNQPQKIKMIIQKFPTSIKNE
jgi:uncharacterized membrane protein